MSAWTSATLCRPGPPPMITTSSLADFVERLCRSFWPVPPTEPTPEVIEERKSMGHLWGGSDYDDPSDWRWFVGESY